MRTPITLRELTAWALVLLGLSSVVAGVVVTYRGYMATVAVALWDEAGSRGDFWGGHLAATTSFAGAMMLLAAVLLQSAELKLQRQEMQAARIVAEQQARALEAQTKELSVQSEQDRLRDDTEFIVQLGEKARDQRMSRAQQSLLELALRRVVEVAHRSPDVSLQLLSIFAAVCRSPNLEIRPQNVDAAVDRWGPELRRCAIGATDKTWLEIAHDVVTAN